MTDAVIAQSHDAGGALTPAAVSDLMRVALESGNPEAVASLDKLVGLAERIADRNARAEFNRSFSAFRAECPAVGKTSRAEVATSAGNNWGWNYASIEHIQEVVDPILTRHGLSYSFTNDDADPAVTRVTCTVRHIDGHEVASSVTIRKGASNRRMSEGQQDAGTLTTAMRRVISMALGLATSDAEEPPSAPVATISDEQAATVREYIESLEMDDARVRRFLHWCNAPRIADIAAVDFEMVNSKLADMARKKAES